MSAKQKTISSKERWQAVRARYTWHLRPPFNKEFDRTHWWKGLPDSKIGQGAALYELARRHPLVGKGLIKRMPSPATRAAMYADVWGDPKTCPPAVVGDRLKALITKAVVQLHEPPSLSGTCDFGLKSWAKLNESDRDNWLFNVGALKGLDFRSVELQCRSIKDLAHFTIILERKANLRKKGLIDDTNYSWSEKTPNEQEKNRKNNLSILHKDLAANPPTEEEWEAAIACRAVEAFRQGFVVLAVAPDLKADTAASAMVKTYHDHLRFYHPSQHKKRARWEDWLCIISEFENVEANLKQRAKSQVFIRYRRALDAIQFG